MYYFIYFSGVVFFSMQNKTKGQCMPKMTNFLPERNAAIGKPTTIKTSKQAKKTAFIYCAILDNFIVTCAI